MPIQLVARDYHRVRRLRYLSSRNIYVKYFFMSSKRHLRQANNCSPRASVMLNFHSVLKDVHVTMKGASLCRTQLADGTNRPASPAWAVRRVLSDSGSSNTIWVSALLCRTDGRCFGNGGLSAAG